MDEVMLERNRPSQVKQAAFTLVELLVSLLVVTVLIAILVPTLSGARAAARNTKCLASLSQIASLAASYSEGRNRFPRTEEVADEQFGNLTLPRLFADDDALNSLPPSWKCPRDDEWPTQRSSYSFLPARFMRAASDNADYRPASDDEGLDTPQAIYLIFEQSPSTPIFEDAMRFHVTKSLRQVLGQTGGFEGIQAGYLDGSARIRK